MVDANSQTRLSTPEGFRVIIVGGSIAGLTLALALEKCGVDYVLLEKREIAPCQGQSIFLVPCTSIVLDQLGVGEAVRKDAFPLEFRHHRDEQMKVFCLSDDLKLLRKKAGMSAYWVDRQTFLQGIYDGIRDRSATKIRQGEGIVSYEETTHGVVVTTDKGNTVEGSVLVGADGVHSTVRKLVSDAIRAQNLGKSSKLADQLANPFKLHYRCLFVTSHNHYSRDPTKKILEQDAFANNTYYREANCGVLTTFGAPGKIFWGIYIPQETQTTCYPSANDDHETAQRDIDAVIRKYGHLPITPWYTIQDLWDSRDRGVLVGMEEGLAPCWNNGGRVLMIGDSVHKSTSNIGLGGNLCVDDVCVLVNGLIPLLEQTKNAPSTKQLAELFSECEKAQRFRSRFAQVASRLFCDFETQSTWWAPAFKYCFAAIPAAVKTQLYYMYSKYAPRLKVLPASTVDPETGEIDFATEENSEKTFK